MLKTTEDRKQMIARILTPLSSVKADACAIADRALWSWERIAFHLMPLIGEAGFHSLYSRAVHLTLPDCPTITLFKQSETTDDLLQKLRADLAVLDAGTAEFCSNTLLNKFTELLSSMIGDSLTGQILRTAWDEPSAKANVQEGAK